MGGEEFRGRGSAAGEDYREVNNRRVTGQQADDYREVTREKMRFLRTLTVRILFFMISCTLYKMPS